METLLKSSYQSPPRNLAFLPCIPDTGPFQGCHLQTNTFKINAVQCALLCDYMVQIPSTEINRSSANQETPRSL